MAIAEIFNALGDPVRLEMVQRLSSGQPQTISVVSSDLGITRQGARKHLQVLENANVIRLEPRGRDVFVQLELTAIDEAKEFISKIEQQWDRRLMALKNFVGRG